jgi:predicted  nucleic acid-binding Zn-ribbon protein
MTTFEIIQIFLGSGGLIGILFLFFRIGKTAEKIEHLETSMNDLKSVSQQEFDSLKESVREMQRSITKIEVQIGKLEIRVEERTLRVVQPNYEREPAVR